MRESWTGKEAIQGALRRLEINRLVVSIHQASFPPGEDDIGYGTPYSHQGHALASWLAEHGFSAIALGPGGITSARNPSPYDATVLSRNPLHIAWGSLVDAGLLDRARLAAAVAARPGSDRVEYPYAWQIHGQLLAAVAERHRQTESLQVRLRRLQENAPWLREEMRFVAAAAAIGHEDWERWAEPPPRDQHAAEQFLLGQLLVRDQHADFRHHCHQLGMRIYGDLAIGMSHRDRFLFRSTSLTGYAMGAPPSRTNPEGQPWGYPVLHPQKLSRRGEAWRYAATRLQAMLEEHDGVRIDHPHGWVCPWVYRTDGSDPLWAVQHGARLFESPDLPDHPLLAKFARVRPEQIDRSCPRHDDNWVRDLEPTQVDRYALLLDLIVQRMKAFGLDPRDLMVEVLSTCPRPLGAVLRRHRLGRYRVTQKADLCNPKDVYRSDAAQPQDWIMVGNHDTPPLRAVIAQWQGTEEVSRRATYLAARLRHGEVEQADFQQQLMRDPASLATAMFADLFCGPACNVLIFWADLFGLSEPYNRPGVVDVSNWSLRVPFNFREAYQRARERREAPNLELALAWALHARHLDQDNDGRALRDALTRLGSTR